MHKRLCSIGSMLLVVALSASIVQAQSGTKAQGAGAVGLSGYCPVSIVDMHKWVRGKPEYVATYDGKVYYFAAAQAVEMFKRNPAHYVPAFGGDCVVAFAKEGKRVPGSVRYGAFYKGRLFLFCSRETQQEFLKNPAKYAQVELGFNGYCPVCLANGQAVKGKPEISAYYRGIRYQFPSEELRDEFLKNPDQYVAAAQKNAKSMQGSGTRAGSGTR